MHGKIVGISAVHAFPDIGTDEEALLEEYALELRVCIWRRAFGMEMVEVKVPYSAVFRPEHERVYQGFGCAGNAAKVYVVVVSDSRHGLVGAYEFKFLHHFVSLPVAS